MNFHLPFDPIQFVYGAVAVCGGAARYLNNYTKGTPFNVWVFFASTFVSGFSGYMFALTGVSMGLPEPILFMLAGTGGFFGDQTMKLLFEIASSKVGKDK